MKRIVLASLMFVSSYAVITAQKNNINRKEITSCIETNVILRDTTKLKNLLKEYGENATVSQYNYDAEPHIRFLNEQEFKIIRNSALALVHTPKSLLYIFVDGPQLTKEEAFYRVVECDSIKMSNFNEKGEEIVKTRWACDSVTVPSRINRIKFYESWFLNTNTNMIEKELLGYSFLLYDVDKKAWKLVFSVFKNKEAVEVAKKKMAW